MDVDFYRGPCVVSRVASKKLFPWHRAENDEESEFWGRQTITARERTPEFIQENHHTLNTLLLDAKCCPSQCSGAA